MTAPREEPCAACGTGAAVESVEPIFVRLVGHRDVYVQRAWRCRACGESYLDDDQITANDAAKHAARRRALRTIGGDELRATRKAAGLTQKRFEEVLGLGCNSVAAWETGQKPLPSSVVALVRVIALYPAAIRDLAAISEVAERVARKEGG